MNTIDKAATWLLIALTVTYIAVALGYQRGAATVPLIVASITLVLAVVQLIGPRISFLAPLVGSFEKMEDGGVLSDPVLRRRLYAVVGSLVLLLVLIVLVGPVVALPLYVLLFMVFVARQSLLVSVVSTAVVTVAVYGLLVIMISYPLDSGYVWEMM